MSNNMPPASAAQLDAVIERHLRAWRSSDYWRSLDKHVREACEEAYAVGYRAALFAALHELNTERPSKLTAKERIGLLATCADEMPGGVAATQTEEPQR